VGPPELLDGEGPQLPRTTWPCSEPAAPNETAATSLVSPPLPLPIEPPAGAVGDTVAVGVGVGNVVIVGDGLGDVDELGADEHEGDGVAWLPLTSGLVLAS